MRKIRTLGALWIALMTLFSGCASLKTTPEMISPVERHYRIRLLLLPGSDPFDINSLMNGMQTDLIIPVNIFPPERTVNWVLIVHAINDDQLSMLKSRAIMAGVVITDIEQEN